LGTFLGKWKKQDRLLCNIINTGTFTSVPNEYDDGLNIELNDGVKLVELWKNNLVNVKEEIKKFTPEFI
jgi:restriction system protein